MKKKILLTGVTGYLGSYLANALVSSGHEVIGLKRKSSSLRRVKSISSKIKLVDVEALDYEVFFQVNKNIDIIIHTATCYGRNYESVSEIFSANTVFPLSLLDAGSLSGVQFFLNTDTILDQYFKLYALSKNQLLQWGKFFSKQGGIRFVNIRLEHFYGPDDDPSKFSAHVINSCLRNTPELSLTKGEQKRDFIYILDVVSAYMVILEKMDSFDSSFVEFDVGSGKSVSIREFVETTHNLSSSETILAFGAIPYRQGEVMNSEADISKLKALGWQCKYDIEEGLKQVIDHERGRS